MIIIIDEASAKLASFYYHDEILKLQWKRAANMSFASDELHDEFQEKLQENTDFEELYCRIDERNEASVRLAKKLGFTNSGHMDDDIHASIYRKNIKNIKNNEKH